MRGTGRTCRPRGGGAAGSGDYLDDVMALVKKANEN
jgi:hypothetical protein